MKNKFDKKFKELMEALATPEMKDEAKKVANRLEVHGRIAKNQKARRNKLSMNVDFPEPNEKQKMALIRDKNIRNSLSRAKRQYDSALKKNDKNKAIRAASAAKNMLAALDRKDKSNEELK
jgi:hypothetical protein